MMHSLKRHFVPTFLVSLLGVVGVPAAPAAPCMGRTGVIVDHKDQAYPTDVLFTAGDNKTYLIDPAGRVVHTWKYQGFPAKMINPTFVGGRKGIIGVQLSFFKVTGGVGQTGIFPGEPSYFRNKEFGFVDWSGKTLWRWGGAGHSGYALQHHDWQALPDGDVLVLTNEAHRIPGFDNRVMLDDAIREVNPQGRVVWTWRASDHLSELGFTKTTLRLLHAVKAPDFLHMNAMSELGPNKWFARGDKRFAPDNIMISSRDANVIAIISRKTGKIVWRLGPDYPPLNPRLAGVLPRPVDQISGQHDPHLIPEGLPGAGDLLVFDNQGEAGYPPVPLQVMGGSRVLQINPETRQIVWEYTGADSGRADWDFYSAFLGGAQRLPNGNTLIDEGDHGRLLQVTPTGQIVWEYVSPYVGPSGPPLPGHGVPIANWIYRCQAVPATWLPVSRAGDDSGTP